MTTPSRKDGSRSHDYILNDHVARHEMDGWRVILPQHRPIPILATDQGESFTIVTAKPLPIEAADWPEFRTPELHTGSVTRPKEHHAWHQASADTLRELEDRFRRDGLRVRRLWTTRNGFLSVVRPDAIMFRRGAAVAVEVSKNGGVHSKSLRYADFDEIHVLIYRGGDVFRPERPPVARFHRVIPSPTMTPSLHVEAIF